MKSCFHKSPGQGKLEKLEDTFLQMFQTQLWDDEDVRWEIVSLRSEIEKHCSPTSWVDVVNKDLIAELESNLRDKQVSLCAKWAPREGRHFGWLA